MAPNSSLMKLALSSYSTMESSATNDVTDQETVSSSYITQGTSIDEDLPIPLGDQPATIIYMWGICTAGLIGNIGNVMVIGAVLTDRRLRKEGNMFIMNLAIADLCVTAFVDPFSLAGIFVHREFWETHDGLCHMIGSVCLISCVCSLWSIAAISCNRYILICRHHVYKRIYTYKNTVCIILCLWGVGFLLDLPNFLNWGNHGYDLKTMACSYDRTSSYSYTVFFITMFISLPLFTILFCNIEIYLSVRRSRIKVSSYSKAGLWVTDRSLQETKPDEKSSSQFTDHGKHIDGDIKSNLHFSEKLANDGIRDCKRMQGKSIKSEVKLAKTLFIIFILFCICWTPYALLCFIDRYDRISMEWYLISVVMAHSSSSLNSILYALTNKGFREGYVVFLRKCRCKF